MDGVKTLKDFGMTYVSIHNILTDQIYKACFKYILLENTSKDQKTKEVIQEILQIIE